MAGKKILVVDDDPITTEIVKNDLIANGYEVASAKNGLDGLERSAGEKPDLIILDIMMAKMDGYTMLRKLREDDNTKSIPVIILSAYDKMKDLFRFEGISDYIIKPFKADDLLLRVARALKQER